MAGHLGPGAASLPVEWVLATGHHLSTALDELLDTRNQLTRVLLGSHTGDEPAE
jgi:hypothetical protein